MQSSLVKPSAIKDGNGFERPLVPLKHPRLLLFSHTQSLGHLLPHNPAIMTSQVARHLSAGTGGGGGLELSGEAGRLAGLRWGSGGPALLKWQQRTGSV